ncbi:MAG TPA: PAS domain S-box protein [Candidatus Angelobacter sp.]|nr:PAS domain S-box protein [Candidatus Angelobacter sp.]
MDLALQPGVLAEGSTLLILLAGAILLYRSFREKYLIPWMGGWMAYALARLFTALSENPTPQRLWSALAWACFVVAVGLFAGTVFLYVSQKTLLWPASRVLLLALAVGLVRTLWLTQSDLLKAVFDTSCWMVLLVASWQMARYSWGRLNAGQWVLAGALLFLHNHLSLRVPSILGYDILVVLVIGISMMTIVLDDSRVQIQRIAVLNNITLQVSNSQDFAAAVETCLRELLGATRAKAAWFCILEGEKLLLTTQIGLSDASAAMARTFETARSVGGYVMRESQVVVLPVSEAQPKYREMLAEEGIHHLLLVPVEGKSSMIGMLVMGIAGFCLHTESEKGFLKAAARQLGLAAENRNLAQQVAKSRNEWAATFDFIPDYIFVHDKDYRILHANQALLNRLGRSREQLLGRLSESVLPGALINWQQCPYCTQEEGAVREDPCFGGYSVVSTSAYTGDDRGRAGSVHVVKDITETRAAEERYASLFNHMHEGVFISTPEGKILDCNEAFVSMLGYSTKEEILKLDVPLSIYVDPAYREMFLTEMSRQGHVRNFEFLLRRKDGREINVIESSVATRGPSGNIERYQGVVLDVTEMKRAEDEIRRRNRELYVLNNIAVTFNQSFDIDEILQLMLLQVVELLSADTAGVYLFEEETNTLVKSAAYGHRSSWVLENDRFPLPADFVETIKAERAEIIDEEDVLRLPEILKKIVDLEDMHSWMWVMLWRKDKLLGALGASRRQAREFTPSQKSVMIAVGRQLATTIEKVQLYHETKKAYEDLRRTQEQLLQSEKMSAVGQLISGVAHELNNPLTAILGYTQLLETERLEPRVQEFIRKLHKQARRTQKIVQNLLSFARQHKPRRIHVDLRSVMEDTIALRDYDLKVNNITVERDFDAVLPTVVADPHQLEQVYLNIINNAADAMLESGPPGRLHIRIYQQLGSVVSEFHDTGPGITDPKRVFDPFYTTKGVGKGTGLGLSICYGIVKEHGGEIAARNHPMGGATLEVRLPVAVGEKPVSEGERIVARRETRLEGHVLLVDDEEAVLDFEGRVLTAAGLEVMTAASGAAAVEHLKNQAFDVVLLDSRIPGEWSSQDVYRWIVDSRPGLLARTVLVLSNVSDPGIRLFVDATKVVCLVKPFEVRDLLAVIRRLLRPVKAAVHS